MNLSSKTVLITSIVLLVETVIAASARREFAVDPFKSRINIDDDDIKQKNDCDVDASGADSDGCFVALETHTDTINIQGKKNKVDRV